MWVLPPLCNSWMIFNIRLLFIALNMTPIWTFFRVGAGPTYHPLYFCLHPWHHCQDFITRVHLIWYDLSQAASCTVISEGFEDEHAESCAWELKPLSGDSPIIGAQNLRVQVPNIHILTQHLYYTYTQVPNHWVLGP